MRPLILAGVTVMTFYSLAVADETVAGHWTADLGSSVAIDMDVTPDGHWNSETSQHGAAVARMAGMYRQTVTTPTTGTLEFTPTESQTTAAHGGPNVEHDRYAVSDGDTVMRLTSTGDTMVFHKH